MFSSLPLSTQSFSEVGVAKLHGYKDQAGNINSELAGSEGVVHVLEAPHPKTRYSYYVLGWPLEVTTQFCSSPADMLDQLKVIL